MKSKIILLLLAIVACFNLQFTGKYFAFLNTEIDLPDIPYDYTNINIPNHLSTNVLIGPGQNAAIDNDNTPLSNPTTDNGATLGRVLFYDTNLSANQTTSCASCHKQELGFSDDAVLSIGFNGGTTRRHSMGLTNAVWYERGRFFWDERAATLEEQVLEPFQDAVEMGMTLAGVVSAVQSQDFYPELFENAFGTDQINADRISKALAQFIRSMVSVNSKYDIGRAQVNIPALDFPNFTASENNGKRLFFRPKSLGGLSCVGCHSTEAFINPDAGTTNNGLDAVSTDDLGVFEAIPNPAFIGAFKVPSLKNIELTAPYMHDGRFATLEEVVEHYNSGVQDHPNLNSSLKDANGNPQNLNLSEQEKTDVVNFLKTLTDDIMVNDVKFSDPFIRASTSVNLSMKVFLQGAYSDGLMKDDLRANGLLPMSEPYSSDPSLNSIDCMQNVSTSIFSPTVLNLTGNNAIVDWVYIELRDKNDATKVISSRAALLQRDGDIVDVDGMSVVTFENTIADDYYISIRHRNHLGVMTQNTQALSAN